VKLKLKVISYNIHKGFNFSNRGFVLEDIRDAIRKENADLVFLQEVVGMRDREKNHVPIGSFESQFEYLADEIWHHHAYGKNAVYEGGHHGNAILSKYPFRSWDNVDISTNRLEQRGILHGMMEVPEMNTQFHGLCLHLDLFEGGRRLQTNALCRFIQEKIDRDEALLVAGDFNDWRGRVTPQLFEKVGLREAFMTLRGEHARSFPSFLPKLKLDRIYYRGIELVEAHELHGEPWDSLSDHVALSATFEL
jgi:endonuclease/exonuclease/phosphatase family metal-dependent hydrolase